MSTNTEWVYRNKMFRWNPIKNEIQYFSPFKSQWVRSLIIAYTEEQFENRIFDRMKISYNSTWCEPEEDN